MGNIFSKNKKEYIPPLIKIVKKRARKTIKTVKPVRKARF